MFSSLMSSVVAAELGRSTMRLETAAEIKEARSQLLTNTGVVLIRPGLDKTSDGEWLLSKNPLLQASLRKADVSNDSSDMSGLGRTLYRALNLGN